MLRVLRNHRRAAWGEADGLRGPADPPGPARRRAAAPTSGSSRRPATPGTRRSTLAEAHGVRNAQVTGDRPDRHDRPGDGLRHHRHRARLRAGQVQEAGRRRLLQDHQPDGAGGAQDAGLHARGRSTEIVALRGRPRHPEGGARHRPRSLAGQGLHRGGSGEGRGRAADAPSTSSTSSTASRSARASAARRWASPTRSSTTPGSTCSATRLLARADRGRERALLRHDDGRGRAAPQGRAPAGLRLRQPVRPQGQALPLGVQPHPDDGGGPALHQRRHLQDHQHAGARDRRATARRPTWRAGGSASRRWPSTATAPSSPSRWPPCWPTTSRTTRTRTSSRRSQRIIQVVERIVEQLDPRPAQAAQPPQGLHPEGGGGRPQGLPADRRVRGRLARRDLHRHAQGGRGLPLPDEQLRHRHLHRPAVRRAAGGVRRGFLLSRASSRLASCRATTRSRWRRRCWTTSSASWPSPTWGAPTWRTWSTADVRHDALGRGIREGDLGREAVAQLASSGFVRGNLRLLAGGGSVGDIQPPRRISSSGGTGSVQQVEADRGRGTSNSRDEQAQIARLKGYVGDACGSCGNFTLVRNGTCLKCDTCGSTSGCS